MEDIHHSHHVFTHFKHRGMVPLITDEVAGDVPDPGNVQGDILYVFPKVECRVLYPLHN